MKKLLLALACLALAACDGPYLYNVDVAKATELCAQNNGVWILRRKDDGTTSWVSGWKLQVTCNNGASFEVPAPAKQPPQPLT